MRGVILVPRRGGTEHHDRAWGLLEPYYRSWGMDVVVSDTPGPFNLPAARNAAAAAAGDWDVAAFINADCLVPFPQIERAMGRALLTGRLVVPFDHYNSMTNAGHRAGADAGLPLDPKSALTWQSFSERRFRRPFYGPAGEVVVTRHLFDSFGGWDTRFIGPQPEDAAMLVRAWSFDRISGHAYHFWHPPELGSYVEADGVWPEYRDRFRAGVESGSFSQALVDEQRVIHDLGVWGRMVA